MTDTQRLLIVFSDVLQKLYNDGEIINGKVTAQIAMKLLNCGKSKLSELARKNNLKDPNETGHHRYFFNEVTKLI
ncbi:MAG TPA: hypothetical protein PLD32_13195 [Saprospiraceae bacterium]|nr:hypothetical protein [Saprospiraceae bacterium]HNC37516.1 hypothetical protein [Saprospiraceae bacterium]